MLVELKLPPGVYHQGTPQESKARHYASNLVRFVDGWVRPCKGWRLRYAAATALTGKARALFPWRTNSGDRWIGVGTDSHLYVQSSVGIVTDITPSGFTVGIPDAETQLGYGFSTYGAYTYGTPRPDTGEVIPATVWALDRWGEYLVGCSDGDGRLYEWQLNIANDAAAITNAPTGCQGLVVTDERFLFALAAGGNPRKVQWCDQEANTVWTPSATNQAGDFELNTNGLVMSGRPMKGRTLILTSVDAWQAVYTDPTLVYGFERVGVGCGLIAKQALTTIDDAQAVWMSKDAFWLFNGYVQQIPCDVADYVFSDMNIAQSSKVTAVHQSAFGEVWFFYPSSAATENDRYVVWNYRHSNWVVGELSRLSGADKGVFLNPIMVDATGHIYEHEVGWVIDGASAYLELGPIELGAGDRMMEVQRFIPDTKSSGDVTVTFYARMWPNGSDTTYGPYALTSEVRNILFQGREVRVRYDFAAGVDGRVGVNKIDLVKGDAL